MDNSIVAAYMKRLNILVNQEIKTDHSRLMLLKAIRIWFYCFNAVVEENRDIDVNEIMKKELFCNSDLHALDPTGELAELASRLDFSGLAESAITDTDREQAKFFRDQLARIDDAIKILVKRTNKGI